MFKVKISLIYLVLVCLLGGAAYIFISKLESQHNKTLQDSIQHSNRSFQKLKELERREMQQQVSKLSMSALKAYYGVLFHSRNLMLKIQEELTKVKEQERDAYIRRVHGEALQKVAREMITAASSRAGGLKLRTVAQRKDTQRRFFNRLVKCSPSLLSCFHNFTYKPLHEDIVQAVLPAAPNLLLVVNSKGIGITSYNDEKWPGKEDLIVRDKIPAVLKVRDGGVYHGIYYNAITSNFFFVAVAPIFYRGEFTGSIVFGRLMSKDLLKKESAIVGQKLAYVFDGKIAKTSAEDSNEENFLEGIVNEIKRLTSGADRVNRQYEIVNPAYLGYSVQMNEYVTPLKRDKVANTSKGVGFRYLLVLDRGDSRRNISSMKNWTLLLSFLVFFIGIGVIHIFFNQYTAAFKQIDQGIHELIGGNQDYSFEFDYDEELPSSMAQSLNIMLAVLLGRPMPEDEDEMQGGWTDEMFVEETSGLKQIPESEAASTTRQVSSLITTQELSQEPAETYYKRIYNEYVAARQQLSQNTDKVTYMKFIEKLVKNEALLKKKYKCKAVRFAVVIKDGKVTLKPIQIN